MLGTKKQRAEQTLHPAAGHKDKVESCQGWGKGCSSTSEVFTQLNTPCSYTKGSPKKRYQTSYRNSQ